MEKVVKLTESDLMNIVKRIVKEDEDILTKKLVDKITKEIRHYDYQLRGGVSLDDYEQSYMEWEIKNLKNELKKLGYRYDVDTRDSQPM